MKALILTAALPLFICAAYAQENPPPGDAPAETIKKAQSAAWLGVAMSESDDKVVVGQVVPGSPAAKAGLRENDRILRVGDTVIEGEMERVRERIGQQKPGDTIELRFLRGDKEDTVNIELSERPAEMNRDFRGEFRKDREEIEKSLKEKVQDSNKGVEDARREIERIKGAMDRELEQERSKLRDEYDKMEHLRSKTGDAKQKLEDKIELDPYKVRGDSDSSSKAPLRLEVNPDPNNPRQLLLRYLDSEWPRDKADGDWEKPELRLGFEAPLFEWSKGDKKSGRTFLELKTKGHSADEAAVWNRVKESIAHSLKRSDVGPDIVEKVMKAVEEARRGSSEKEVRRTRLEAEAAKLEKEMQSLKERTDKVREELKKATE